MRTKKDPATSGWDVVELQGDELLIGCEEGLLERLDWSQIGGKDHYLPQAVSDCGVGAAMFNFVLSWDKDKFPGTPSLGGFLGRREISGQAWTPPQRQDESGVRSAGGRRRAGGRVQGPPHE